LNRNCKITFRLNEAELAKYKGMVKKSGVSQEAYFRHYINGYVPPDTPPPDYYSMMKELYHIGNNLNQIAFIANATGIIDSDKYQDNIRLLKDTIENITKTVISPKRIG
jgi:hypothetical protein